MIWVIRNLCVRLWTTLFLGIPMIIALAPVMATSISGQLLVLIELIMVIILFFGIDFLLDRIGRAMIANLLREGETWERSGILGKSEQSYIKAIRIFDTFLLSPFGARKLITHLTRTLSRFMLMSNRESEHFTNVADTYLRLNPRDVDLSLLWLKSLFKRKEISPRQEDLLGRIANTHLESKKILPVLTRVFLGLKRKDFTAQTIYQRALGSPALKRHFGDQIQALIRMDEPLGHQAAIHHFEAMDHPKTTQLNLRDKAIALKNKTAEFVISILNACTAAMSFVILGLSSAVEYIKSHEQVRLYLKAGIMGVLGVFLVIFVINTVSHLSPQKVPPKEPVPIEIVLPKPFTIQVAAYLKQDHAEQYVQRLKKNDINARIRMTDGGGKTWYLVMVSEFDDKKSAADYGRSLKSKGIISDFFVNNNES
ncbi:MAG: SPOR domain-containing protein [Desulfobacteraceae bacterium]|nr:MAG: SPOR domain-containing protein [Desulfobacteraceae bacterium]